MITVGRDGEDGRLQASRHQSRLSRRPGSHAFLDEIENDMFY